MSIKHAPVQVRSAAHFGTKELKKLGLPIVRDVMTDLADTLRRTYGSSYIIEALYDRAVREGKNAIIESVRAKGEVSFLKSHGVFLIAIDADPKIRYERIRARKSDLDHITYEKFLSDEQREMDSVESNRGNIRYCMGQADFVLMNNGTIKELHTQIEKILPK